MFGAKLLFDPGSASNQMYDFEHSSPPYGLSINKLKRPAYLRKKPRAFLGLPCSHLQPNLEGGSVELQSHPGLSHLEGCGCLKSFLGKSH